MYEINIGELLYGSSFGIYRVKLKRNKELIEIEDINTHRCFRKLSHFICYTDDLLYCLFWESLFCVNLPKNTEQQLNHSITSFGPSDIRKLNYKYFCLILPEYTEIVEFVSLNVIWKLAPVAFVNSFFDDDIIMIITKKEVLFFDKNHCDNVLALRTIQDKIVNDNVPMFYEEQVDDFIFFKDISSRIC